MGKNVGVDLDSARETGPSLIYVQGVSIANSMDRDRWRNIEKAAKIFQKL